MRLMRGKQSRYRWPAAGCFYVDGRIEVELGRFGIAVQSSKYNFSNSLDCLPHPHVSQGNPSIAWY